MRARQMRPGPAMKAFAPLLLALALLIRMAVPAGWMPAGDGATIVPCAGSGPLRLGAASPHAHAHHHGGERQEAEANPSCPFTVAAAAIDLPADLPLPGPSPFEPAVEALWTPVATAPGRGLAAPPPPPTGPPSRV